MDRQHYDARHRFECPNCTERCTTESAMNRVRLFSVVLDAPSSPVNISLASRSESSPPLCLLSGHFRNGTGADSSTPTHYQAAAVPDNPFPQHVDSNHRPPTPPPLGHSHSPCSTTESGESNRSKDSEAKSPPHVPVMPLRLVSTIPMKLILAQQASEEPDTTTPDVTNPNQDQVGLARILLGHPRVTSHTLARLQGIARSNRFYCQEEDCGRGFSTKKFLDSHTNGFHRKVNIRGVENRALGNSFGIRWGTAPESDTPDDDVEGAKLSAEQRSGQSPVPSGSAGETETSTDIEPPSVGT